MVCTVSIGRREMKLFWLGCVVLASASLASAAGKPRVFITDTNSWEVSSAGGGTADGFGTAGSGGARPQTAEIIKTLNERCPNVLVNNRQEKADYVILLDHEGGKSPFSRDNKIVVFNKDGDSIMSASMRSLGNAVEGACSAMFKDWAAAESKAAGKAPAGESQSSADVHKRD
jgi:hypothetical protein